MIIVTGATGQLGRQIVERLLTLVPADRVGVSVRDPRKAQTFADRAYGCGRAASPTRRPRPRLPGRLTSARRLRRQNGRGVRQQHRTAIEAAVAAAPAASSTRARWGPARRRVSRRAATMPPRRRYCAPWRTVHFAAQRLLRRQRGALRRQRGGARPARTPCGRSGRLDRARRPCRRNCRHPGRRRLLRGPHSAAHGSTGTHLRRHRRYRHRSHGPPTTRITAPDDQFREQLMGQGVRQRRQNSCSASSPPAVPVSSPPSTRHSTRLLGREPIAVGAVLRERLSGTDPQPWVPLAPPAPFPGATAVGGLPSS